MDDFQAVILLDRPTCDGPAILMERTAHESLDGHDGVEMLDFRPRDRSLTVRFDRNRLIVADIVRLLEDRGLNVSGVSQGPAEPAILK